MKNKLLFEKLPWDCSTTGVKQKIILTTDKKFRLVRFDDRFIEEDWCLESHSGFVLEGEMKIEFENEIISYFKGDGLNIEGGLKHKARIEKGKFTELILFEKRKTN